MGKVNPERQTMTRPAQPAGDSKKTARPLHEDGPKTSKHQKTFSTMPAASKSADERVLRTAGVTAGVRN